VIDSGILTRDEFTATVFPVAVIANERNGVSSGALALIASIHCGPHHTLRRLKAELLGAAADKEPTGMLRAGEAAVRPVGSTGYASLTGFRGKA
jgi:hypothetical protein